MADKGAWQGDPTAGRSAEDRAERQASGYGFDYGSPESRVVAGCYGIRARPAEAWFQIVKR